MYNIIREMITFYGKAVLFTVIMEFLKVYGILIVCAGVIVALGATLFSCVSRVRKLEKQISSMQEEIVKRLDEMNANQTDDQKKQRRLFTEGMSGLTESVTRAVFSLKEKDS